MTLSNESALREHRFVHGLTVDQIATLAAHSSRVSFAENEVVLTHGQRSSDFYFLLSGSVAIELYSQRFALCVQALGSGEVFGWSSLLDDQDTVFRARARESTVALRISGESLKMLCRTDPGLGCELLRRTLQVVAGRVRATEMRFAEMCGVRMPS